MTIDRDSDNSPLAVTLQAGAAAPATRTFATDANGNPTGLEQSNGRVDANDRYVYDPYGDLDPVANTQTAGSDAAVNPLRFNGFDYDSSVKTYDMQARDYRPDTSRFLQTDRYEDSQSDLSLVANPLTQNRYDFAGADPVDNVEFDGHTPGMGTGCATSYCGDNQGGDMTVARKGANKGKSTNQVTPNASGTGRSTPISNPAARSVAHNATPQVRAAQRAEERAAPKVAERILGTNCLERCSNDQRADNVARLSRALILGLPASQVGLHKGSYSENADLSGFEDAFLNPVNVAAIAGTGGTALLIKAAVRAGSDAAAGGAIESEVGSGLEGGAGAAKPPFRPNASHIFRQAPGHLAEDTTENRELLQNAIDPENFVGTRGPNGMISEYRQSLPDGKQVWVHVREGREITNGGVNDAPR